MKQTSDDFRNAALEAFPALREDFEEYEGLIHVQMGAFARLTQQAIDSEDTSTMDHCFSLAHRFFHDADPELKNAFYVSYLEHLNLDGKRGQAAYKRMSSLLQAGYREINQYLDKLFVEGEALKKKKKR